MKKLFVWLSRVRMAWLVAILVVILGAIWVAQYVLCQTAEAAGSTWGNVIGAAVGSYNGITEALGEGYEDGTDQGLSAEDPTTEIENSMERIGKLEVLAAGVSLTNFQEIGQAYAGLQVLEGTVRFVVDLDPMWLTYEEEADRVIIHLPMPEPQLEIDWESSEILAEKQNFDLQVSTKDTVEEFFNSKEQLLEKYHDCISNYDTLQDIALETAEVQVENLVQHLNTQIRDICVEFQEEVTAS